MCRQNTYTIKINKNINFKRIVYLFLVGVHIFYILSNLSKVKYNFRNAFKEYGVDKNHINNNL